MPEDEFLGLMDICDVFDLIWLEEGFAASVAEKLAQNPVIGEKQLARLEKRPPGVGHSGRGGKTARPAPLL